MSTTRRFEETTIEATSAAIAGDQHDPRRCPQAPGSRSFVIASRTPGHAHARNVAERGVASATHFVLGGLRRVFVAVRIRSTGRQTMNFPDRSSKDRGETAVGHVAGGNARMLIVFERVVPTMVSAVIALGESRAHFQSVADLQREDEAVDSGG